jgi:hypothetical protein
MTGVMENMGREGDTKIIWDSTKPHEVEAARRQFDFLVKEKGYQAFKTDKDGKKLAERIKEFNPEESRMILVPNFAGG